MQIEIFQLLDGAKAARGLTVIIDVFRAFSLACYLTDQGAEKIIPVGDIKLAYRLKEKNPDYMLIGERLEKMPEGFDFGNSPTAVRGIDFTGKTIVHTTSSGTQGIVAATRADEIITGSFVNADAIVRYIRHRNPQMISLVCMGYATEYPVEEDTYCAEYIKSQLQNKPFDFSGKLKIIRETSGARFFKLESQLHAPSSDFDMCTKLGIFNFILRVLKGENGSIELKKIVI